MGDYDNIIGVGLGMLVVCGFVEVMGGMILVIDILGGGFIVVIDLVVFEDCL